MTANPPLQASPGSDAVPKVDLALASGNLALEDRKSKQTAQKSTN